MCVRGLMHDQCLLTYLGNVVHCTHRYLGADWAGGSRDVVYRVYGGNNMTNSLFNLRNSLHFASGSDAIAAWVGGWPGGRMPMPVLAIRGLVNCRGDFAPT